MLPSQVETLYDESCVEYHISPEDAAFNTGEVLSVQTI